MENMSKEEKEAIEYIKAFQKDLYGASSKNLMAIYLDRIWNYIDKLQEENKELKEKINKVVLMIDDNYRSEWYDDYETIAGLRDDIYDLLKIKYKGVKD